MRARWLVLAVLIGVANGCGAEEPVMSLEGTIQLRSVPGANEDCPLAAAPLPMVIRIDPNAPEQVVAVAQDGKRYHIWWAQGFAGGPASDRVIMGPNGIVVARDGDILAAPIQGFPVLGGYQVCASGDSLYVLSNRPPA